MAEYGINVNMAATLKDNGLVEIGAHMTDSNDIDFSTEVKGANMEEAISKLTTKFMEHVQESKMSPTERRIKELEAELAELRKSQEQESECDGHCGGTCSYSKAEGDDDDLINDVAEYLEKIWDQIGM